MRTRIKWMTIDAALAALSLVLAYALRITPDRLVFVSETERAHFLFYVRQALLILPILVVVRLFFFTVCDLYRSITRFAGMHELRQVIMSVTLGTAVLTLWELVTLFLTRRPDVLPFLPEVLRMRVPLQVVGIDWMACLILVGGARMAKRLWALMRFNSTAAIHNVLIVGAGNVGELVARHFLQNPQTGYRPVGFVDEDHMLWGKQIHGLPVFGGLDTVPDLIERHKVAEVLVALPKPSLRLLNELVATCERAHVGFKIVPAVSDVMAERVSISQIRTVEIEDLLGREPIDIALDDENNYLEGQRVLITGAGGSIGSELCRQVLRCNPERLILLGRGENSIYEIETELRMMPEADDKLELVIADIQDAPRMAQVFERWQPNVLFHAAAHKHVPLMELHPGEAVKNNILGTFNVALLSQRMGVKRFILISTDKAVHPTSVMGASKRVAEMIVSALSVESATEFLAVRFGNVLGSRGSVVPKFRRQIAAGGPVTVTHPDAERYFMTIPEAVNLVLQAGAIGGHGQLFLLDMGEQVRIADLARRMITLSGYEPDMDIDIQYIGLRPGEKIKEELVTEGEDLMPTEHPKIMATRVEKPDLDTVKDWLKRFDALADEGDSQAILEQIRAIVPEYRATLADEPATPDAGESTDEAAPDG